jgi:hypothetical protein
MQGAGETNGDRSGGVYCLRLRVGPVAEDEVALWTGLLQRLPAVAWARPGSFADGQSHFILGVTSLSRLHMQLNHAARSMDARFTPTAEGELSIMLREPAPAWPSRAHAPA